MSKFVAPLARSIAKLARNTSAERAGCYDRARLALVDELYKVDPPVSEDEINRERLELEQAIRTVEVDALRRSLAAMPIPNPAREASRNKIAPTATPPAWLNQRTSRLASPECGRRGGRTNGHKTKAPKRAGAE